MIAPSTAPMPPPSSADARPTLSATPVAATAPTAGGSAISIAGRARLAALAVSGEGFVFDPRTGESYLVNPTARIVLAGLQAGRDEEALVAELAERYGVSAAAVRRDLIDFCEQLHRLQLV